MKTLEDIRNNTNESLVKNIGIGKSVYFKSEFEKFLKKHSIQWRYERYVNAREEYVIDDKGVTIQATMAFYNDSDVEIPDYIVFDKRTGGVYLDSCPRSFKAKDVPYMLIRDCQHSDAYLDIEVGVIDFDGYMCSTCLPSIKSADVVKVKDFLNKGVSCGNIKCNKFVFDKGNIWEDDFVEEFKKRVHYKKITIKDKSFILTDVTKIDSNSSIEDILVHLDLPKPTSTTDAFGKVLNVGDFVYFGRKGGWANIDCISFGIILNISDGVASIKTTQYDKTSKFNKITNARTVVSNCIKIDKNKFLKEAKFKF